jgi:hypothetical protein
MYNFFAIAAVAVFTAAYTLATSTTNFPATPREAIAS